MRIYTDRTVDAEFKDLGDLGFTGALNDRQFAFLRDAGYTNSLADMMYQHRSGGGVSAIVGTSDTIVSGGITWTLSAPCDYGYDQIGRAFVVATPGLTVVSRSPAATTVLGSAVSGTMKNPQFSGDVGAGNGWDQRITGYSAGNNQSFPISVTAGDILVGQIHGATPAQPRDGYSASYNPIYFVASGWYENAIAPAPIGWSGRGTPTPPGSRS